MVPSRGHLINSSRKNPSSLVTGHYVTYILTIRRAGGCQDTCLPDRSAISHEVSNDRAPLGELHERSELITVIRLAEDE